MSASARRVAVLFGAAAFMVACNADREDFISPIGDVILTFTIGTDASPLPAGSGEITSTAFAAFDPDKTEDAFSRGGGPLGLYLPFCADDTCLGFDAGLALRNDAQDPRLPTLVDSDADAPSFFGLFNPNFGGLGAGQWDLFGGVTGLAPNTTYTVVLARMALTVNGELDAQQVLLGDPVTDPDQLSYLGGTEGGRHDIVCDFTTPVPVNATTNPLALGIVTTDGSGAVTVDCIAAAVDDSPWWRDDSEETPAGAADSVPVGINASDEDGGEVRPGQFNYILLIEGQGDAMNPVPNANPTVRIQLGPDVDASGTVIPNAMAPFPTAAATQDQLMTANGAVVQATGLELTFENLVPVSGAYQVWVFNEETDALFSPAGDVTVTNLDTLGMEVVVSQATSSQTFNPTDVSDAVTFVTNDSIAGGALGPYTHAFVTIEAAAAGAPSMAQPLYGQYTDMAGEPDNPVAWTLMSPFDLSFGTFGLGDSRSYAVGGFGDGAFAGSTVGTSDFFRARFRNLPRPPVGYVYEGYFQQFDDDGAVIVDASIGGLTTDIGEGFASLDNVDVDQSISAQVSPTLIVESVNRATLDDVPSAFEVLDQYVLRLRPKSAATATGGYQVLGALLPETLTSREDTGS